MSARTAIVRDAKRVVIKVGSSVLSRPHAPVYYEAFYAMAREIAAIRAKGIAVVLVSSGAIALGMARLGLAVRPEAIQTRQAVAAVGQGDLMHHYAEAFSVQGVPVAQVLLTHDDLGDRRRFLNVRRTFQELLVRNIVPIVNENDTVASDEIRFGDNDRLAALVTNVVEADLLILQTDRDGLYDRDPDATGAARIPIIRDIAKAAGHVAAHAKSRLGVGGMASKLDAARTAAEFGVPSMIVNGHDAGALGAALSGRDIGTLILPSARTLKSRKHWIAFAAAPSGAIRVDSGAMRALQTGQKSLLPSGVIECSGAFETGDAVRLLGPDGAEFARGLVNYSSDDVVRIAGKKTSEIESVLGVRTADEIIHRDNLVVVER